ncbi:MAG: hypothetical protein K2N73_09050 [Lachnospiraceae bacterium]|nr:hypothetical protein [Lachnospiraceae bacterium]
MPTRAVTQYGYDSMNRLTMENRNGLATTYTYDMAGNRTARVKGDDREQYRYNSRNQLTELTGMGRRTSYQYDPAGNLTQEQRFIQERAETRRYAYDAYNRNTEVRGEDFLHKNFYDAEGLRNRTEENGKVTDFVYSGGIMLTESEEQNNITKNYVFGNEYLGYKEIDEAHSHLGCYVTDEQGSIRYILSNTGEVQNYYQYSAFGEMVLSEEIEFNRLGYNSQMEDKLTGLIYLRARHYNPIIGRFVQEDILYDDGFNLYAYCDSNPIIYGDFTGFGKEPVPFNMGRYHYDDINDLDFGKILTDMIGPAPSDMYDPHAHHILFKIGRGSLQKQKVQEAQRILAEVYDIDPIGGKEVLCWAPNRVTGQHGIDALDDVYNDIISAYENGESKEELMKKIDKRKKEAQGRTNCNKKKEHRSWKE